MRTYKGKYTPAHPKKYIGDHTKIIYRSGWERRFMIYCDQTPAVLKWNSESIIVSYISPVDNRAHKYYVDFLIIVEKANGKQETILIEVKPLAQCNPPKLPKSGNPNTKRYIKECVTYSVNQAKWDAAKALCAKKGWTWKVMTENELTPKGKKKKK